MSRSRPVVGVISDTHGLLRPAAVTALGGSDLILHAGDVGNPEILDELRRIAPVIAVRGNIDTGDWAAELPVTAVTRVDSVGIYVIHDVQHLAIDPVESDFQIVVSGHSHKPSRTEQAGVVYLNPGAAGPRRFHLPVTVGRLDFRQIPWTFEIIDLM